MNTEETVDYSKVKAVILKKYEINVDTYLKCFRSMNVLSGETPKELYVHLQELYRKWMQPDEHTKQEIREIIILEQLLRMLNPEVYVWIKEHDPSSALEAARLTEIFVSVCRQKTYHYTRGTREGSSYVKVKTYPNATGKPSKSKVVCYNWTDRKSVV